MNILVTGASRGIGAAAFALLRSTGHQVAGHSTRGSDELIAGDLADPDAPGRCGSRHSTGRRADRRAGQQRRHLRSRRDDSSDEDGTPLGQDAGLNLQAPAYLSRLAIWPLPQRGGGGRIVTSPAAPPTAAIRRSTGTRRVKGGDHRHDKTIARGYAAEGILAFAVAPGFTVSEMTDEYLAGRGGAAIVADIPLGRVATTDEVAEAIRWLAVDAPASATGTVVDVNGASYVR